MNPPLETRVSEIILRRIQEGVEARVDVGTFAVMCDAAVDVYVEDLGEQLIVELTRHVWCVDHGTKCAEYPATWWDAFKQRWAPRWWLARWPVKTTRRVFSFKECYPNFRQAMPRERIVMKVVEE